MNKMSDQAFSILGGGKVAYGTPILVTDSREAAIANAMTHELETVSVH